MTKVVGWVSRYTSLRLKTGEVKYFGSTSVTETQEYYFDGNRILGDKSLIGEGVIVIFELEHQKDNSEPEAINIELVTENSDLETLSICAQSNKDCFWLQFFKSYLELALSQHENTDKLIKLCIKKLNLIKLLNPSAIQDKSEFERGTEKKIDFLKSIPSRFYLESTELRKKLEQLTTGDYSKLYNNIPIPVYVESKVLRNKLKNLTTLTTEAYWNIYDQIYQESKETEKIEEIVDEVSKYITYLREQEQNTLIHALPNNLKREPKIFQSFKPKVQVDYIWDTFQTDPINVWDQLSNTAKIYSLYRAFEEQLCIDHLIDNNYIEIVSELSQDIIKDIIKLSGQEENTLIQVLPNKLRRESKIFQSFKPKVQVDYIWDSFKANPIDEWDQLSNQAKVYSLYRAFEEKVCINDLIKKISQDDDPLICFAKNLFSHKTTSFEEIDKSLLTLIIKYQGKRELLSPFFNLDYPYNLDDLFLENDDWDDLFSENKCNQNLDKNDDSSDDLSNDLILENFLYNKNVNIVFNGTKFSPREYIKKIEAWMDFVRQNPDRLKCRICQKFMNFDPRYTKHSKIYDITVFHCPDSVLSDRLLDNFSGLNGSKHNYNVYINHCWNWKCRQVIDSRDSFQVYGKDYRDDYGWVKCKKCGAGKQLEWDR